MSIDAQAEAARDKWVAWVKAEGDGFWKFGNIPDEAMAEWIPGYLRGVQDRIAAVHEGDVDHDYLWGYGEELGYLRQPIRPDEMIGKCYATGYIAGYQSIGGGNG